MPSLKQYQTIEIKSFSAKWVAVTLLLSSFIAKADELDTLQFRASLNKTHDSNLFRRASNEVSDQITTTTLGVKLDKTYSLQRVLLDVSLTDYKYDVSNFLDFTAKNYNGSWQWSLTPSLTGSVSTQRAQSQNNFGDFRSSALNIRTQTDNQFLVRYSPHNVWSGLLGFTQSNLSNSAAFTAISDFDSSGFDTGVSYQFPSGTSITLQSHRRNAEYKKRPLNPLIAFDNGYEEQEYEANFFMADEGRSKLNAKIGYLDREYNNFTIRNYSAVTGYVDYELILTGKLRSNINLSRILAPYETITTTYSLTDSISGRLTYNLTSKVQAGINAQYGERDFGGRGQFGSSGRLDKDTSYGAILRWVPIKNVGFSLSASKSHRNSTLTNFSYDDTLTYFNVDLNL